MARLVATKSLKYRTRRLVAGDEFDAEDMHAKLLIGIRKAKMADEAVKSPPRPTYVAHEEDKWVGQGLAQYSDEQRLRLARERIARLGIVVDGRWGLARLESAIEQYNAANKPK